MATRAQVTQNLDDIIAVAAQAGAVLPALGYDPTLYGLKAEYNPVTDAIEPTGAVVVLPKNPEYSFGSGLLQAALGGLAGFLSGGLSTIYTVSEKLVGAAAQELDISIPSEVFSATKAAGAAYNLGLEAVMADGFFDSVGDFFSGFDPSAFLPSSETFSNLAQIATPIIGAFTTPTATVAPIRPSMVAGPVYGGVPSVSNGSQDYGVYPVATSSKAIALRAILLPIQKKVGAYLQTPKLPTVPQILKWAMQFFKTTGTYASVALALGITIQELYTLIANKKKRRRMNVCNVRALRRSLRRVEGFGKVARRVTAKSHSPLLRRRSIRRGKCTVCRSNPCACG